MRTQKWFLFMAILFPAMLFGVLEPKDNPELKISNFAKSASYPGIEFTAKTDGPAALNIYIGKRGVTIIPIAIDDVIVNKNTTFRITSKFIGYEHFLDIRSYGDTKDEALDMWLFRLPPSKSGMLFIKNMNDNSFIWWPDGQTVLSHNFFVIDPLQICVELSPVNQYFVRDADNLTYRHEYAIGRYILLKSDQKINTKNFLPPGLVNKSPYKDIDVRISGLFQVQNIVEAHGILSPKELYFNNAGNIFSIAGLQGDAYGATIIGDNQNLATSERNKISASLYDIKGDAFLKTKVIFTTKRIGVAGGTMYHTKDDTIFSGESFMNSVKGNFRGEYSTFRYVYKIENK